jgi:hypothetical protein
MTQEPNKDNKPDEIKVWTGGDICNQLNYEIDQDCVGIAFKTFICTEDFKRVLDEAKVEIDRLVGEFHIYKETPVTFHKFGGVKDTHKEIRTSPANIKWALEDLIFYIKQQITKKSKEESESE